MAVHNAACFQHCVMKVSVGYGRRSCVLFLPFFSRVYAVKMRSPRKMSKVRLCGRVKNTAIRKRTKRFERACGDRNREGYVDVV